MEQVPDRGSGVILPPRMGPSPPPQRVTESGPTAGPARRIAMPGADRDSRERPPDGGRSGSAQVGGRTATSGTAGRGALNMNRTPATARFATRTTASEPAKPGFMVMR